MTIKMIRV